MLKVNNDASVGVINNIEIRMHCLRTLTDKETRSILAYLRKQSAVESVDLIEKQMLCASGRAYKKEHKS